MQLLATQHLGTLQMLRLRHGDLHRMSVLLSLFHTVGVLMKRSMGTDHQTAGKCVRIAQERRVPRICED